LRAFTISSRSTSEFTGHFVQGLKGSVAQEAAAGTVKARLAAAVRVSTPSF